MGLGDPAFVPFFFDPAICKKDKPFITFGEDREIWRFKNFLPSGNFHIFK